MKLIDVSLGLNFESCFKLGTLGKEWNLPVEDIYLITFTRDHIETPKQHDTAKHHRPGYRNQDCCHSEPGLLLKRLDYHNKNCFTCYLS